MPYNNYFKFDTHYKHMKHKIMFQLFKFIIQLLFFNNYIQTVFFFSLHFDKNSYVDESGMRVIVGHYVGGSKGGNLSDGKYFFQNF